MKPTNNKAVFHTLCDKFEELCNGSLDIDRAKEISDMAKQINNSQKLEFERVKTLIKSDEHFKMHGTEIKLRSIDGKEFE